MNKKEKFMILQVCQEMNKSKLDQVFPKVFKEVLIHLVHHFGVHLLTKQELNSKLKKIFLKNLNHFSQWEEKVKKEDRVNNKQEEKLEEKIYLLQ